MKDVIARTSGAKHFSDEMRERSPWPIRPATPCQSSFSGSVFWKASSNVSDAEGEGGGEDGVDGAMDAEGDDPEA
jgi:hypothetical protein